MASSWTSLRNEEITPELIQKHLRTSQSDYWVAAACFDRLLEDVFIQRILLELGLERTQSALMRSKTPFKDSVGDSSAQQDSGSFLITHFQKEPLDAQMCAMRVILLDRLDRLNTYAELHQRLSLEDVPDEIDEEWEDDPWAEAEVHVAENLSSKQQSILTLPDFLTNDLLHTALYLASRQQFAALETLLQRHASCLLPYRFFILDSIPEHSNPSAFRELLPAYNSLAGVERYITPKAWRSDPDWTETQKVRAALSAVGVEPPKPVRELASGCPQPLSSSDLLKWYIQRINAVINSTGMIDIALALTQHGASSGLEGLDEIGEDLSLFSRLVYDAPRADVEDHHFTLDTWRVRSPREVIQSYLAGSNPTTIVQDIQRLVYPYLFVLESRADRSGHPDPSLHNRLLYDYVMNAPLEVAAAVFEASKPTLPKAKRLIKDDEDIARLALSSLYGSDSVDEWATMSRIFECMPAWESAAGQKDGQADSMIASLGDFIAPSTTRPRCTPSDLLLFFEPLRAPSLSRALDFLDMHLESGEILSRWNVPAQLRWFLQSMNDEVEQRSWAHRMSRRAGGSSDEPDSPEEYQWLLEDMLKLSGTGEGGLAGAFGLISRNDIISIFFSGLLNSASTC
jgi:neuroblastoma-amplified sequence